MICSIPASKSSSKWLDRLRSSRGFPLPSSLDDLDQFLSSNPSPPPSLPDPPTPKPSAPPKGRKLFDIVNDVLADLFVMGDPPPMPRKTGSRKQPNPRACSGALDRRPPAMSPSSADNSVVKEAVKKERPKARRKRAIGGGRSAAGAAGEGDLTGFSRTEVTVIDSSSAGWKSEKVVFRKGLVWKVRDRKGWSSVNRKKRKLGAVEKQQGLTDVKTTSQRKDIESVNEVHAHTDKRDDSKETDNHIFIPRRRPKCSKAPHVPAAKDPIVFRLKVITTGKRSGAVGPVSSLKVKS